MKKLFITGSCGFLFSNFIRKSIYAKLDYKITSIDSIESNHILNSVYQNKNHTFHIGSCTDKHLLKILFKAESPDIVIHSAISDSIENNVNQTISLLEKCKEYQIERFIYISSDEVYGSSKDICFSELSIRNPENYFAIGKSVCEDLVEKYCRLNKINFNIIRVSNFFGPRQNKKSFLVNSIDKLKNNKEVVLGNFGKNTKDWGYVVDAVNGISKIINSGKENEIYNLSTGYEFTECEILDKLCEKNNFDKNLIKIEHSSADNYNRVIPTSHKLRALDWAPEISIDDGIEMFSKWYLDNNWWFND